MAAEISPVLPRSMDQPPVREAWRFMRQAQEAKEATTFKPTVCCFEPWTQTRPRREAGRSLDFRPRHTASKATAFISREAQRSPASSLTAMHHHATGGHEHHRAGYDEQIHRQHFAVPL